MLIPTPDKVLAEAITTVNRAIIQGTDLFKSSPTTDFDFRLMTNADKGDTGRLMQLRQHTKYFQEIRLTAINPQ